MKNMGDTSPRSIELAAGSAVARVAPDAGGRLWSLEIDGHELLVTSGPEPYGWGAFPMVPYAGRIRRGVLVFRDRSYQLPITLGPHAIHGTLTEVPWHVVGDATPDTLTLAAELVDPWPFRGLVTQRLHLEPSALELSLEVDAAEPMPVSVGWHPWFRRRVEGASGELELDVDAGWMYVRDEDHMVTPELVRPKPRPWDDCFTALRRPPRLRWPGLLDLGVESNCRYLVVYDEPDHAICVEPQTAPPDALNWMPPEDVLIEPDRPLLATMTLRWSRPEGE